MRILMTGASGFVARSLRTEFEGNGHEVLGVDLVDGDLTLPGVADKLIGERKPDVVVHLAAAVSRLLCEDDREDTIRANPVATMHVATACAKHDARLVYTSTSEVYGDQGEHTCLESDPLVISHNLYGATKYWAEQAAQLYAPDGLQIIRPSMPYGPMMPVGRGCCALVNFLWWAATDQPMTVHSTGARAWCWIGDLVNAIRTVVEKGEQADSAEASQRGMGIYNVGRDDNEVSMVSVAKLAVQIAGGSEDLVNVIDPPKAQTAVKRLSMQKAYDLGYTPKVSLEDGMRWVYEHDFQGLSKEELLGTAPQHRLAIKR